MLEKYPVDGSTRATCIELGTGRGWISSRLAVASDDLDIALTYNSRIENFRSQVSLGTETRVSIGISYPRTGDHEMDTDQPRNAFQRKTFNTKWGSI